MSALQTDEYKSNPKTLSNLDELSREKSVIDEQRCFELRDLAQAAAEYSLSLFDEGLSALELISVLSSGLEFGTYPAHPGLSGLFPTHAAKTVFSSAKDRADFVRLYLSAMAELGRDVTERAFLTSGSVALTVGYVKNQFADEAFDVFSQDLDSPRVRYYSSFRDCAQALERGEVGYCLFPLEERGGVRLHTVSEIVYRFDLKIDAVTPVFGFAADADIKYALVSRRFMIPEWHGGDDRYIELRLSESAELHLSELLYVAEQFDLSVYRLNTVTFDTEGESSSFFSIVLRGAADFSLLLTYIALFANELVPVGIYKNLE